MAELPYGEFSAALNRKGHAGKLPMVGQFELTFKCALECFFCYCTVYTSPEHTKREVSTAEAKAILTKVAEAGCLWMTFSGGDPFVRPDFREIYAHARALGIIPSIFCSGLIATDDWIEYLRENRPLRIELPLYGVTRETYEAVSGKKNTFDRAVANIRKFVAAGLPVRIKSKISKKNFHERDALGEFIEKELGLEFNPSWDIHPRLDGSRDHLVDRLDPLEVRILESRHGVVGCDSSTESLRSDDVNPKVFRCGAGVHSFYVNPYGELNFCSYVRKAAFDVKTGDLGEGMQKLREELLGLEYADGHSCKTCAIQAGCENCPGHAVLETGSYTGKSQYLCDVNHELRRPNP